MDVHIVRTPPALPNLLRRYNYYSLVLLEMEYEPEAKSASSIAQSAPLSQRMVIPESGVSNRLNDPLKAGW